MSRLLLCSLALCVAQINPPAAARAPQSGAKVDVNAEVRRLIATLQLRAGASVADVGAGSGEVTFELARQLGPGSRVFATDINPQRLQELTAAAAAAGALNVVILEGHSSRTNLPDACCDAIIVRYVYHHFADPPVMNASILRALKPGGRLAVMDHGPRAPAPIPPALRSSGDTHGVHSETVETELRAAGFELRPTVLDWPNDLFLVLAERPTEARPR